MASSLSDAHPDSYSTLINSFASISIISSSAPDTDTDNLVTKTLPTSTITPVSDNDSTSSTQFTDVELSSSSIFWLQKAFMTNQEHEALRIADWLSLEDERKKGLKQFTLFPMLPTELQDKIWEWYALTEPRFVDIAMGKGNGDENFTGWGRNEWLVLRQINRQTRADTLSRHGYIDLKHVCRDDTTWLYNPGLDILILNRHNLRRNGLNRQTVVRSLEQGGALDKVKVAVLETIPFRFESWMASFKNYSALEIIFLVVGECHIKGGLEKDCEETSEFNEHGVSRAMRFRYEILPRDNEFEEKWEHRTGRPLDTMREELYEKVARGPERAVPYIVFVRQVWIYDHY